MRVATVAGHVTLFYDGSRELWNRELEREWMRAYDHYRALLNRRGHMMNDAAAERQRAHLDVLENWESWNISDECRRYWREKLSWQQIIIVDGVTEIPEKTFLRCFKIKRVIFADTVIRIETEAFGFCKDLVSIKLSLNLEFIGLCAFIGSNLSAAFIPPRCREICESAFEYNENLTIMNVHQETELGGDVIKNTALAEASPFEVTSDVLEERANPNLNQWLKNMNNDDQFNLHRACSSFQPLKEVINAIIVQKGLKAFRKENSAGITPSKYLEENPYTDLTEKEIINDYLMKMMGEVE